MRDMTDRDLEAMIRLALRKEADAFVPRPEWMAQVLEGISQQKVGYYEGLRDE